MFRIDLLIGFVQPQNRRANQMRQPMQIPGNQMLITEPSAKNVIRSIYNATSKMRFPFRLNIEY